ncbi:hypothetical protein BDZ89DRAFT_1156786 [Hymenopellis radicata]|nr:hypothetical protein BDZ89DRAFT_1156786 [Hymenopellis radicata]
MLFVKTLPLTILVGIAFVNAQGNDTVANPPPVIDPGCDSNVTRCNHYNRVTGRDEASVLATGTVLGGLTSFAASYLSEATGEASSLFNEVTATATAPGTEKTGSALRMHQARRRLA